MHSGDVNQVVEKPVYFITLLLQATTIFTTEN